MDFKNYLKISAQEINLELEKFFKNWSGEVETVSARLSFLNYRFIEACAGGKRLRGSLVKLGYELTTGQTNSEILKPAAAFEIFQTSVLAHDDIIDQSDLRRGVPTLWKSLGGNHYGISQTICLGDVGFFLSYKLISESNFPEKEKNKAITYYTNSMIKTALGEILDVEVPHSGKADEQTYFRICQLKTAFYTLTGPLQLGAVLAGADKKLLENMEIFGEKLGVAFQIQDDILGIFGDEKSLGKSVTSDIMEGKITLLLLYAKSHASKKQKEILKNYYGIGAVRKEQAELIKAVFLETGALEYSQKKAEQLVIDAQKIIPLLTTNSQYQTILTQMADFLVNRSS